MSRRWKVGIAVGLVGTAWCLAWALLSDPARGVAIVFLGYQNDGWMDHTYPPRLISGEVTAQVSPPETPWRTTGRAAPCREMDSTEPAPTVPLPNSYWVAPGRFLAGENPGDLEEQRTEARLVALLEAGLRTFIDLTEEHETDTYALLLRCLAEERHLAVTYLRIPISDRSVASDSTMRCILGVIDRSMADGQPVYVHCFAGIGRTGTVVGCHLRRHAQAAPGAVVARIAELRKWMPCGGEESPHTPAQMQLVETWPEGA